MPVGARFSATVQPGPGAHPASCTVGTGSFPGVKSVRGVTLTPRPLLVPWSRDSRAIPLLPLWVVRPVQNLSACTVQLYRYSPYWPYGLYRASVPVQYSYTSTPPVGRTACTEPQCLYKGADYLTFFYLMINKQQMMCRRDSTDQNEVPSLSGGTEESQEKPNSVSPVSGLRYKTRNTRT